MLIAINEGYSGVPLSDQGTLDGRRSLTHRGGFIVDFRPAIERPWLPSGCVPAPADPALPPLLYEDWRYGGHDATMWPQFYNPDRPHMPWVAAKSISLDSTDVVFRQLVVADFHRGARVAQDSGTLSSAMLTALTSAFFDVLAAAVRKLQNVVDKRVIPHDTMLQGRRTLQYLRTHGASIAQTFRMASSVQRDICELRAFVLYREDMEMLKRYPSWTRENLRTDLVGCFVVSPGAQHWFFRLGISCWLCTHDEPATYSSTAASTAKAIQWMDVNAGRVPLQVLDGARAEAPAAKPGALSSRAAASAILTLSRSAEEDGGSGLAGRTGRKTTNVRPGGEGQTGSRPFTQVRPLQSCLPTRAAPVVPIRDGLAQARRHRASEEAVPRSRRSST